jgi:hypothetical protein
MPAHFPDPYEMYGAPYFMQTPVVVTVPTPVYPPPHFYPQSPIRSNFNASMPSLHPGRVNPHSYYHQQQQQSYAQDPHAVHGYRPPTSRRRGSSTGMATKRDEMDPTAQTTRNTNANMALSGTDSDVAGTTLKADDSRRISYDFGETRSRRTSSASAFGMDYSY